jgi:hypothetical protein
LLDCALARLISPALNMIDDIRAYLNPVQELFS